MTNCEAQNMTQCHTETMKILHTSDWHLGRTFHRSPLTREHQQFIDELLNYVHAEGINTLLISGDVYDSTIPTAESTTLLDQALTRLMRAGVRVILSSGNHDSFRRLSYGAAFFEASGVHLRTSLEDATRPVELTDGTLRVHVYAIPYLAPRLHATALGVDPTHQAVLGAVTNAIRAIRMQSPRVGVVAAAKADGKLQFSFNATDSAFEIVPQTFTWELASTDNIAIVQQNFLDLMAECRIEHLYLLHNPLGENENIPTYAQALKLEGHNPFFSNVN